LLFLPLFLRPDHHEIHDDEKENVTAKKPMPPPEPGEAGLCA